MDRHCALSKIILMMIRLKFYLSMFSMPKILHHTDLTRILLPNKEIIKDLIEIFFVIPKSGKTMTGLARR